MTPEQQNSACRFNERQKLISSSMANFGIAAVIGAFGLWWTKKATVSDLIWGGFGGIALIVVGVTLLAYMKDEV
ncbi:MAG: hypothetical protein ACO1NM_04835 [Sphingobium phenoxybenzoativorans]